MIRLAVEPWETYNELRSSHVGSHDLAIFASNPRTFNYKQLGLMPGRDSAAFRLGRMAHTLILEGAEAFDDRYRLPPAGAQDRRTKAHKEYAESLPDGCEAITEDELYRVNMMHAAVQSHDAARDILDRDGQPEGVVRTEIEGVAVQSRYDWFVPPESPSHAGIIADLKTVGVGMGRSIDTFEDLARAFGYIDQLAFYRLLVRDHLGLEPACYFIAVESGPPFTPGVWRVSEADLDHAERVASQRLRALARAQQTNQWTNAYAGVRILTARKGTE